LRHGSIKSARADLIDVCRGAVANARQILPGARQILPHTGQILPGGRITDAREKLREY
jgi:hypothetical protein